MWKDNGQWSTETKPFTRGRKVIDKNDGASQVPGTSDGRCRVVDNASSLRRAKSRAGANAPL